MFKFLLYIGFIFFLIYWFLVLPFKPTTIQRERPAPKKKTKDGNLNIDYIPEAHKKSSSKGYDDGDYVDYEEVK